MAQVGRWPTTLRDYVERALSGCGDLRQRTLVEKEIAQTLQKLKDNGKLLHTDFSRLDLPKASPGVALELPTRPKMARVSEFAGVEEDESYG